jgi:hypothetical protein
MTRESEALESTSVPTMDEALSARWDRSLELLFDERCEEVMELLSRRWWRLRRPWDAERRNNLSRILADLGDARRLDAAHRLSAGTRGHLRTLLRRRIGALGFDGILDLRDELRKALIPIGDDAYIQALLEEEHARQAAADTAGRSSTLVWRELYDVDPLVDEIAADRLLAFCAARREQYRTDRKRVRLRQQIMLLLAPVLAVLTAVAAITCALLIDGPDAERVVLLVIAAGGIGALLGSIRPLSEDLNAGADLRAHFPVLLVEPLMGAIFGLLLLMVAQTGILGPTTADGDLWARTALLAFAAGFVEPLVLRAVSRIASIPGDDLGHRPRRAPAEEDRPGSGQQVRGAIASARFGRRRQVPVTAGGDKQAPGNGAEPTPG